MVVEIRADPQPGAAPMAYPPAVRPQPKRGTPPEYIRQKADAALGAVLTTVEQRCQTLDQWECFYFRRGVNALRAGNYRRAWIEADCALTPLARRSVNVMA